MGLQPVWTSQQCWTDHLAGIHGEFQDLHIPAGVVELKQDEFQALKQGSISVCEYHNRFTPLSRYALGEVDSDAKK